ncbi:GAF domain protein [compost metagenome]
MEDERRKRLGIGEGLIGQCIKSRKSILINDIPEGELTISYTIGSTKPRNVIAVPIFRDGEIIGAMEFGSLQTYTPLQIDFLNSISNNIGVAIHVSQNRSKLQEFLEETQAQA